ncbi:response regulator [Arcobacter peruensis]|uniref:response regulator n=1 Tax=Arcobacter peruensis TaxID=2320140 RepID=UPI000F07F0EF|nr:response regulator [Arcobacter peruensis]
MNETKYKILVVDDEEINLQIIEANLQSDYIVDSRTSIKEALSLIEENLYDAFIFDINMDEMDGLDLCKIVKNYRKYIYTPVIFVTVVDEVEKIEKGFSYGAYDYITKPVNPKELKIRLKAHIKISKNQIELNENQLHLNEEIQKLTKELVEANKNVRISEEIFQGRETKFKYNDERIKENLNFSKVFDQRVLEMQEKLEKQKILLSEVKKSLG